MPKFTSRNRHNSVNLRRTKLSIPRRNWSCLSVLVLLSFTAATLEAQTFSTVIPSSDYGYLDQYNMNTAESLVGDDACVPTSTTNALTLLQNLNPGVFGTGLSGSTYTQWQATDHALIHDMGTTANNGTSYVRIPYGINSYLGSLPTNYTSSITLSGQFSTGGWDRSYPQPSYISAVNPTAAFIYNALLNLDGVLLSIDYSNRNGVYTSGGHELLANGITWDSTLNSGTISFIDPLDPSQTYGSTPGSDNTYPATGPALETTGTIALLGSGSGSPGSLLLEYDQYNGTDTSPNPVSDGPFYREFATIDNVLALGVVPEPSNYGMLLSLAALGLIVRRRYLQPKAVVTAKTT